MGVSLTEKTIAGLRAEKWKFDQAVTGVFDDMLERSIPQYEVMRQTCFDIGSTFVEPGTEVVDLGCSTGLALDPFVKRFGAQNRFIGVEMSDPMLQVVRDKYAGFPVSVVDIRKLDLRTDYPSARASLTLAVLTIQFTPIEYRQKIMSNIYKNTAMDGALILVEKVLGESSFTNEILVQTYHSMKAKNGYSQDEIERKRLQLEGVLVPVAAKWNEEMLEKAGFSHVECFWRWCNFAGWLAIKS